MNNAGEACEHPGRFASEAARRLPKIERPYHRPSTLIAPPVSHAKNITESNEPQAYADKFERRERHAHLEYHASKSAMDV